MESDKKRKWAQWPNLSVEQSLPSEPAPMTPPLSKRAKLRELYSRSLPKKLKGLEHQWNEFLENVSKHSMQELYRHCHNITGSGASFGFSALSDKARNLEEFLRVRMDSSEPTNAEHLTTASSLFQELEDELLLQIKGSSEPLASIAESSPSIRRNSSSVFSPMVDSTPTFLSEDSSIHGKILVVEDDEFQAEDIKLKLEECHFSCRIVHSGAEAILQAPTWQPELILLDLVMAEMDGFQTFEKLRKVPGYEHIPVIFLSSMQLETNILKAYELGANDYLTKPVNSSILTVKLHSAIIRYRALRQKMLRPTQLTPGLILEDRYRVIQLLGSGGMGVVYLVEDLKHHDQRALKLLNASPEQIEVEGQRFQREVDAIRKLKHPNLVALYDSGVIDGFLYYTMSALPNGDLADYIRANGSIPVRDAITLVIKMASALQHIHDHNLLHRDLKPENILFSEDHEPVLTDLGLVLDMEDNNKRLTKTGYVVGTVQYMSPEQILRPGEVDHRVDIYALGVLLYELVAGLHPFDGRSHMEVMAAVLHQGYPPLSEYVPDVNLDLEAICQVALHKDPDQRFQSARDMIHALEEVLEDLSSEVA